MKAMAAPPPPDLRRIQFDHPSSVTMPLYRWSLNGLLSLSVCFLGYIMNKCEPTVQTQEREYLLETGSTCVLLPCSVALP